MMTEARLNAESAILGALTLILYKSGWIVGFFDQTILNSSLIGAVDNDRTVENSRRENRKSCTLHISTISQQIVTLKIEERRFTVREKRSHCKKPFTKHSVKNCEYSIRSFSPHSRLHKRLRALFSLVLKLFPIFL